LPVLVVIVKCKNFDNVPEWYYDLQRNLNERGSKMALKNVVINAVDNGYITTIRTETAGYPPEEKHYVDLTLDGSIARINEYSDSSLKKALLGTRSKDLSQDA
jgi:hypothetical protein